MRLRSTWFVVPLILLTLTGCATSSATSKPSEPSDSASPAASVTIAPPVDGASSQALAPVPTWGPPDDAAIAQAQMWLDTASLPPSAVRSDTQVGGYTTTTGWPCGPIAEATAYWTIPDVTVAEAARWMVDNPTPGLISTASWPFDDTWRGPALIGFIPEAGAQEGIVFEVVGWDDGVAVRAQIAALAADSTCLPIPDGDHWGAPGQG